MVGMTLADWAVYGSLGTVAIVLICVIVGSIAHMTDKTKKGRWQ